MDGFREQARDAGFEGLAAECVAMVLEQNAMRDVELDGLIAAGAEAERFDQLEASSPPEWATG